MTAISKNVYFNVLNSIVDEYNNTYHKTFNQKKIKITVPWTYVISKNDEEMHDSFYEKELQKG